MEQPGSTAGELQQVAQLFNTLREKVVDAVTEARAFAAQQQNDLATLKRSSAQVREHGLSRDCMRSPCKAFGLHDTWWCPEPLWVLESCSRSVVRAQARLVRSSSLSGLGPV